METEKIIIQFYLEYVSCVKSPIRDIPIFIFKNVIGEMFYVSYENESITCLITERDSKRRILAGGKVKDSGVLKSLGNTIFSLFDKINLNLYRWSDKDCTHHLPKHYKNQLLLSILNCLDMNFSHKSMITDRVTKFWDLVKKNDMRRFENLQENLAGSIDDRYFSINETYLRESGRYFSDEVYKHFKKYGMRKKIDVSKITCIQDVFDKINFIKLDVKIPCYGGRFDLIGIKGSEDEGYTLVIREVDYKDLQCRYYTMPDYEKGFVYDLVDKTKKIKSVIEQGIENNNVNGYKEYIEYLIDHILSKEENECEDILNTLDKLKEEIDGETEEERINREFGVRNLIKIAEGIGKRIDRDRKYITSKDISPILDGLKSTIDYLKSIEPKD